MIKVEIESKDYDLFLKKLVPKMNTVLEKGMMEAGESVRAEIVKTLRDTSKRYTGGLANSYDVTLLSSSKGDVRVGVLSDSPYAEIQNEGGTITPKGKYLAIPQTEQLKRSGKWPRDFAEGELYAVYGDKGGVLLDANTDILQYVLTKAVTIRGKRYLEKSVKAAKDDIEQIMGKKVKVAVVSSSKVAK